MVGQDVVIPKSRIARVIIVVHAFVILIVLELYTANLTNHFVFESIREAPLRGIDEFISKGHIACVEGLTSMAEQVHKRHPRLLTHSLQCHQCTGELRQRLLNAWWEGCVKRLE